MKTVVDIFSGFLGAGKTMLIKKFLYENMYGRETVIIENEFGEVGIDGEILKETNIAVKEINSGCICCQVSGDFGNAVKEIIKNYEPHNIIIEPSGVAKLSEILSILNEFKFQHQLKIRNIFTLIDIQNYDMYIENFREFYEDQIRNANKIVLSRTQFVDDSKIKNTISSLRKHNSKAEIIFKPWDNLSSKSFFYKQEDKTFKKDLKAPSAVKRKLIKSGKNHHADEFFESYPINLAKNISTDELKMKFKFVENSDKYGQVLRAKGIIESINGEYYQFDYVPKEFKYRKITWSNKRVISIIGNNLNKKELNELFN